MEGMEIKNVIAIIVLSLIVAAAGKTARNEATPYQRFCTNANCPTYEHSSSIVANGDDCDSFCICTCDGALYMKCPEGLQYDDRTKSCDWPSVVGCGSTTQSHGPTTTPRPQGSCEKVKPQCPANNGVNATLLPNPDDCGSYCVCDWGNAIWMPCPAGLEFNPTLHVCDWPAHAGCGSSGGSTTRKPGSTTRIPPTPPHGQNGCDKVQSKCPAENTGDAILMPNPDDCGSYCVCDWGNAILMPCPPGLEFNPKLMVCDWPANAGCSTDPPTTITHEHVTPTKPQPTPGNNGCYKVQSKCPAENSGNAILLPNPDDCGSYCVCDWGNAIYMSCPAGLEFNAKLMVCDWPANAGCSSPPVPPPTSGPKPTSKPGNNGCAKVQPKCPAENSGNAILLPNPDDCGSYCVCDWGNAIYMSCPAGLEFNAKLMVCDWPANAGCSSPPVPPPTSDPVGPTGPPPTSKPGNNGCAKVQPKCPAENSGNAILLPNPDDCGSYCVCDWGNAIYMSCPAGLEFNAKLMVCDWPANAGCSTDPVPPPTSGPVDPNRPTSAPVNNGCSKVQPKCPAENSGNAILLPNPDDCGSYCVCDWGNAIYMSCPDGLEFNAKLMVCDWPANAGCSSPPVPPPTSDPVGPTGPPPTSKPGNNGCAKVQPKCPAENSGNAILLPNPDDCGSYCVCDWGNAIYMSCPAGLEFNAKLMVCDWPANAGCSSPPVPPPTSDPVGPTGPPPTSKPGNNGCAKVQPKCPAENSGNAILLPNPDDCGSYCVCDWGNAIYMSCPAGLEFNAKLMVCDWPANAGCSSPPVPPPTSGPKPTSKPGNNGCAKVQPKCPAENSGNAILLPNPDDCGSYCVCDWGNAIYMSCPDGLEFNAKLMVCDWPANAGCSSPPVPPPTSDPVGPTGPPPTSKPGNNGCAKVQPKCPAENSGNAILLPNPDDCGSYCVCDWGNAIYMSCPAGLEFNAKLMVCDWPANAGCSSPPVPPPTSDPVGPTGPPPTSKPGNNGCAKVQPKCPAENSGNAILLPNPDDCGSYCVCDWGNAIYMSCPAGLEFNAKLMVCDWPANAGCSSPPVPPPTSGPKPTSKPGNNGCAKVQPKCPAENSGNAILLPNPDDCGSYCVCDWGNAIYMSCPAGLEFNAKLMVCDWPANAGCSSPPVPPPTSGPKPTSKPGNNGCAKVQPKCPAENSGNAILLPNPDDCGSYCVCDWGNAIYMSCPAGLEFNAKLMVCDWPANAGCSTDPVPPPTSGPVDPNRPTSVPVNNGCSKVQPKCPAENSGNAILLPNPDDCGSYCVCDWGNAIYMSCPAGLEFNAKLMVCDWPANAGCSTDPVPPPTSGPVDPNRPTSAPVNNGCSKVQPKCPAENSGNAILLPNPDDCGSYCVCDWGNAIYMSCPAGTEFNPKLMVCDWPANAGCSSDPVNPPPSSSVCVDITCPPTNGVNATLLPNPHDCSSYCVCDYGRPFVMPCPSGLEFNPNLKVCDWPKNAGCTIAP